MKIAITRAVSPRFADCELTHTDRQPIDYGLAVEQHAFYEKALASLGCSVVRVDAAPELPDGVFVEDCAVVFDELAIITNPGADSRKPEVAAVVEALRPFRSQVAIEPPGTLDGGDVLCIGKQVWVGLSSRSNEEAVVQMQSYLEPHGYDVSGTQVAGCLHLKSAVTQVAEDTVLLNPAWVDASLFDKFEIIETHPDEPAAANALLIGNVVVFPTDYPLTAQRLTSAGLDVRLVDNSEVIKAEGGVTCCSLVFDA